MRSTLLKLKLIKTLWLYIFIYNRKASWLYPLLLELNGILFTIWHSSKLKDNNVFGLQDSNGLYFRRSNFTKSNIA